MDGDQQRYYQRNMGIGIVLTVILVFVFSLWVNSLDGPPVDKVYYGSTPPRIGIRVNPFARKIRIEGVGSGNKIGISQTEIAQSGAGEQASISEPSSTTVFGDVNVNPSALSAFESRLEEALGTLTSGYTHAAITPPDSRRLEVLGRDSIEQRPIVSLPFALDWTYASECPETTVVHGYIVADQWGTMLIIESLSPDNHKVRRAVKRTFARSIGMTVSGFRRVPYVVRFITGEGVVSTSTGNYDVRYR